MISEWFRIVAQAMRSPTVLLQNVLVFHYHNNHLSSIFSSQATESDAPKGLRLMPEVLTILRLCDVKHTLLLIFVERHR